MNQAGYSTTIITLNLLTLEYTMFQLHSKILVLQDTITLYSDSLSTYQMYVWGSYNTILDTKFIEWITPPQNLV